MHKLDVPYAFYYKLKMQQTKHFKIANTFWSNSKCIVPPQSPKMFITVLVIAHGELDNILFYNLVVCWL